MNDLQRKLNMRSRVVTVDKWMLPPNQPYSSQKNKEKQKEDIVKKVPENKKKYQKIMTKYFPL